MSTFGIQTFYKTGEKTLDTSDSTVKVFRLAWRRRESDGESSGNEDVPALGGRKSVEFNNGYALGYSILDPRYIPIGIKRTGINIEWTAYFSCYPTELLSFIYE